MRTMKRFIFDDQPRNADEALICPSPTARRARMARGRCLKVTVWSPPHNDTAG
jgi:hypothetical protein